MIEKVLTDHFFDLNTAGLAGARTLNVPEVDWIAQRLPLVAEVTATVQRLLPEVPLAPEVLDAVLTLADRAAAAAPPILQTVLGTLPLAGPWILPEVVAPAVGAIAPIASPVVAEPLALAAAAAAPVETLAQLAGEALAKAVLGKLPASGGMFGF